MTTPSAGVNFISPAGDWDAQVALFARMKPTLSKVQIPAGFSTSPHHVEQLISAMPGPARTVILRTEDCKPFPDEVRSEIVGRGFLVLIDKHPDVTFIIEIGNEPKYCGLSLNTYLDGQRDTIRELKPEIGRGNLLWMPSLPLGTTRVQKAMASYVGEPWDAVGVHLYGNFQLGDEGVMGPAYDWLVANSHLPIYISEMGINDTKQTTPEQKAWRYVDFLDNLPSNVHGAAIWTISQDGRFPTYQLTSEMMDILATHDSAPEDAPSTPDDDGECHWFSVTRKTVCDPFLGFWRSAGLDTGELKYNKSLELFGYPLTDAFMTTNDDGDTVLTQVFERAIFEHHPKNPPEYQVLLRRLGAEWLEASS